MFTASMAAQRNSLNQVRCKRRDGEYRVTLLEDNEWAKATEAYAYYTDDLEDACLTGASMRRSRNKAA